MEDRILPVLCIGACPICGWTDKMGWLSSGKENWDAESSEHSQEEFNRRHTIYAAEHPKEDGEICTGHVVVRLMMIHPPQQAA